MSIPFDPFGINDAYITDGERERRRADFEAMSASFARQAEEQFAAAEAQRRREALWDIPFIDTSVSQVVFDVIQRCMMFGQNGLLIGAPGVGKTKSLQEAERRAQNFEGPNVALVTVTGVLGSSTYALFEELCPHLGVRAATSIAATQKRLMKEACFRPVMIFDEAQNLTLKSARELLEIGNQSRIQMLFCGNSEVLKLVGSKQAAIQQIARRLPVREEITCILDTDADLITNHFGVEGLGAYELCRVIGSTFHVDGIVKVLSLARHRVGDGRTIRHEHIRAAIDLFPHFKTAKEKAIDRRARGRIEAPPRTKAIKKAS